MNHDLEQKSPLEATKWDAVLLDDDEIIHSVWEYSALRHHKKLRNFRSVQAFLEALGTMESDVPLFIDVSLGHGLDGRDIADKAYKLGFKNISLATGYSKEKSLMTELTSFPVVSKSPPWERATSLESRP